MCWGHQGDIRGHQGDIRVHRQAQHSWVGQGAAPRLPSPSRVPVAGQRIPLAPQPKSPILCPLEDTDMYMWNHLWEARQRSLLRQRYVRTTRSDPCKEEVGVGQDYQSVSRLCRGSRASGTAYILFLPGFLAVLFIL